jgi:hypothetical protein
MLDPKSFQSQIHERQMYLVVGSVRGIYRCLWYSDVSFILPNHLAKMYPRRFEAVTDLEK